MKKNKINAFTLLEIVVSLGILALGILGIFSLIPTGVDQTQKGQEQGKAIILAQTKMEEIIAKAAENWDKLYDEDGHFIYPLKAGLPDGTTPLFMGPFEPSERENWGWIKKQDGTWVDDLGYQWVWHFVKENVNPLPADGKLALISLTVSWPQKLSMINDQTGESDLIGTYTDLNSETNKDYFKTNGIQFVRMISYVSKGL
ncbi:MAG: hypothetical protein ACD_79C00166G0004 [uncultured bacterium]|nr:MAG: hypothetical protein ACD_79C00166G0004 [uncultured bacterium]